MVPQLSYTSPTKGNAVDITTYFDHETPNYTINNSIVIYNGERRSNAHPNSCTQGYSCYDGHPGYDYASRNRDVVATAAGTITIVYRNHDEERGWPPVNALIINHDPDGDGVVEYQTKYWHLANIANPNWRTDASPDTKQVMKGTVLGRTGSTGNSTGPHLHFEVLRAGRPFDPYGWRSNTTDHWHPNFWLWADSDTSQLAELGYPSYDAETMNIEDAAQIGNTVVITGWAINRIYGEPDSGVDHINVYLDGDVLTGTYLGEVTDFEERTDIGNRFGDRRFDRSGFVFQGNISNVEAGLHTFYVYARSTEKNNWFFRTTEVELVSDDTPGNVALSLDRSGSMSGQKIDIAKKGARFFTSWMSDGNALAVTSFSSSAQSDFPLTIMDKQKIQEAKEAITAHINAGGGTNINEGLKKAFTEVTSLSSERKVILLMSDGRSSYPDLSDIRDDKVIVHSIAIGNDADQPLMEDIARQTGGEYLFVGGNWFSLIKLYQRIIAWYLGWEQLFGGGAASTSTAMVETQQDDVGIIMPGETVEQILPVDSSVSEIGFSLIWFNESSELGFTLVAPDGTVIDPNSAATDPNIEYTADPDFKIYFIQSPQAGQWVMRVTGDNVPDIGELYLLAVSGQSDLRLAANFESDPYYVGQPINIIADLSSPTCDGIDGATVTTLVTPPQFSSLAVAEAVAKLVEATGGEENAVDIASLPNLSPQQVISPTSIVLQSEGDGRYRGVYNQTSVPGSYNFEIFANGDSCEGVFTRQTQLSTFVDQPIPPSSGIVLLQARSDHSGTDIFLIEQSCSALKNEIRSAVIPGIPHTVTNADGYFEITPISGRTYQCLQAVQREYLVGQKAWPQGNLGTITLLGGDVTQDDIIDIFDLAYVASRYDSTDPTADINADGLVDIFDLVIVAGNYDKRGPQAWP